MPCPDFGARGPGRGPGKQKIREPQIHWQIYLHTIDLPINLALVYWIAWFPYSFRFNCKCPNTAPWRQPMRTNKATFNNTVLAGHWEDAIHHSHPPLQHRTDVQCHAWAAEFDIKIPCNTAIKVPFCSTITTLPHIATRNMWV